MTTRLDHWRQMDVITPDELSKHPVTLIGAGGIGSYAAEAITTMGVDKLTVYDPDVVELHNLTSQSYDLRHIGMKKVEALRSKCLEKSGTEITIHDERFVKQPVSGIVISAVDSMEARVDIWNAIRYNPTVCFYIDARMGIQVTRIHTVRPWDMDEISHYEQSLYTNEVAVQEPCTAQAVIYTTYATASFLANMVKRIAKGDLMPMDFHFDHLNFMMVSGQMTQRS